MIELVIALLVIVAVAIVLFILVDKAGLPEPIPLIVKLAVLIIALVVLAQKAGYA